jgi:hypothetical protein
LHFGIDTSVLGYSTQDYLLRGDALFHVAAANSAKRHGAESLTRDAGEAEDRVQLDRVRRPTCDVVRAVQKTTRTTRAFAQIRTLSRAAAICLRR